MNREKVIKGLDLCSNALYCADPNSRCNQCPYRTKDMTGTDEMNCSDVLMADALSLLKEDCHNCKLECLLQKYDELKEKYDALLKEQEAKVLTVDQLEDALDTVVWLETPVSENLADGYSLIMAYSHKYRYMYFDSPFGDNPSQDSLEYSEYGRSWRCWDRRPSEEQRKAVKWNENP